jgi:hypothetical protein
MAENKKCEQLLKGNRRNHKEINRRNPLHMIAKEGLPRLQWPIASRHHVDRNRGLGDLDAELEQLAMDLGSAPQRVLKTHSSDEIAKRSLEVRGSVAAPKAKPSGARARLGAMLSAISSRMSAAAAVIPRALTPAPTVGEAQSSAPRSIQQPSEEPPSDVLLIYAGDNAGGAQFIPDAEYPPGLRSLPLANWKASIAANNPATTSTTCQLAQRPPA